MDLRIYSGPKRMWGRMLVCVREWKSYGKDGRLYFNALEEEMNSVGERKMEAGDRARMDFEREDTEAWTWE